MHVAKSKSPDKDSRTKASRKKPPYLCLAIDNTRPTHLSDISREIVQNAHEESQTLFLQLLDQVKRGELIGAVVLSFRRPKGESKRNFALALSGVASTDPTLAAGALSACQVLVQELVLQDVGLL
jgi:hypothetical protein